MSISVKRVYDAAASDDGYRILVDRLWPRGMTREAARVDLWLRDIGPSTELRKWFGHEPDRWPEFQVRYADELNRHGELLDLVQDLERHHDRVTLLYGARDRDRNEAQVIAEALRDRPAHSHG
jgi:uncharacterized protein YeaO (DUF488 family)